MAIKTGDKITKVKVGIDANGVQSVDVTEHSVIGVNDFLICVDDFDFSTISIGGAMYNLKSELEELRVVDLSSMPNQLYNTLFLLDMFTEKSDFRLIEQSINEQFTAWLDKKVGVYGRAMQVDIKLGDL